MGFSNEWDEVYRRNEHQSIWPWSNLISLSLRQTGLRHRKPGFSVLEIGCGAGANIPFFRSWNVDYYAVEGSSTMVEMLRNKFPEYEGRIKVGDFTKSLVYDQKFDLIADRGAITHNGTDSIGHCLDLVHEALADDGVFIGTDWFSDQHDQFAQGLAAEDEFTRTGFTAGPFANVGQVHFSSDDHIQRLFEAFNIVHLSHVLHESVVGVAHRHGSWLIAARKS